MSETDPFSADSIVNQAPESPGARLAAVRYEYDLSQADVASYLNLRESVIDALERDDYEQLPGPTFAKGYLRAYARLLNLDEEEIVGGIEVAPMQRLEVSSPARSYPGRSRQVRINPRRKHRFRWLIWILMLGGALIWYLASSSNFQLSGLLKGVHLPFVGEGTEVTEEISFPPVAPDTESEPVDKGGALLEKAPR